MRRIIQISVAAGFAAIEAASAQSFTKTTLVYEDWTVSCSKGQEGPKTCGISQIGTIAGQEGAAGQVTIGRLEQQGPLKLVVHVAANVSLDNGLKLLFGPENRVTSLAATFRWCTNTRCMAERDLSDEEASQLRKNTDAGKIEFKDANGRAVSIPVSFKAFGPAYDRLLSESTESRGAEPATKTGARK